MTEFSIKAGKNTPHVNFQSGTLLFKGKSFPENARKFFENIGEQLKAYSFGPEFRAEIDLDYMSSSSVICILDLLKRLKKEYPSTRFHVRFLYDAGDEDMQAVGENYARILEGDFSLVAR